MDRKRREGPVPIRHASRTHSASNPRHLSTGAAYLRVLYRAGANSGHADRRKRLLINEDYTMGKKGKGGGKKPPKC